jgi:hypothetical protein
MASNRDATVELARRTWVPLERSTGPAHPPSHRLLGVLIGTAAAIGCALAVSSPTVSAASSTPSPSRLVGVPMQARGVVSAALRLDRRALSIDSLVQQSELSDTHGINGEEFGEAVAISGHTLVVGTIHYATVSSNLETGVAYVFTAPASGWAHARQSAILKAPGARPEEAFGRSVAISGNTIVVGAPFREVGGHPGQGVGYVFEKPASGWRSTARAVELTGARGRADEAFGESVAVSGNAIFVGAPGREVSGHAAQGAVDVFALPHPRSAGAPAQQAQLIAADGAANDALGISVAVSGHTLVAGADLHRVGSSPGQGAAYVFVKRSSRWRSATDAAELTDLGGQPHELFGRCVAVAPDAIVVGAPDHSGANPEQGAAYVFAKPSTGWAGSLTQTARLTASDAGAGDVFGGSLSISGDVIVVGAPGHGTGRSAEQGAAYAFAKPASGWSDATETYELAVASATTGDRFGRAVAVSGATLVVGAPNHETAGHLAQGVVYVFGS